MKVLLCVVLLLSVAGVTTSAYAADDPLNAGTFFCSSCIMDQPAMDPDTRIFITTVVNNYLPNGSWQNPPGTGKLMYVTICNSSICVKWQYTGGGQFLSSGVKRNDGTNKYKNPPDQYGAWDGTGSGGGPGGFGPTPPGPTPIVGVGPVVGCGSDPRCISQN